MKIKSEIFNNEEHFIKEKELIFNKSSLFISHIDSLNEHPVQLVNIINDSFFLSKGNGKIFLYSNLCPHRLTPLDNNDCNKNHISCPYHGLKFELNGKGIDHPLNLRINELFINNNLIFNQPNTHELLLNFINQYKYYSQRKINIRANWKLCLENLLDQAHINFVHKKTLAGIFKQKKIEHTYKDEHFRFFVEDKDEIIYTKNFIFPNLVINQSKNFTTIYCINAISPTETNVDYILLTKSKYKFFGYFISIFSRMILNEDKKILEKNQKGQNISNKENILIEGIDHFSIYFYKKYFEKLIP